MQKKRKKKGPGILLKQRRRYVIHTGKYVLMQFRWSNGLGNNVAKQHIERWVAEFVESCQGFRAILVDSLLSPCKYLLQGVLFRKVWRNGNGFPGLKQLTMIRVEFGEDDFRAGNATHLRFGAGVPARHKLLEQLIKRLVDFLTLNSAVGWRTSLQGLVAQRGEIAFKKTRIFKGSVLGSLNTKNPQGSVPLTTG